MIHQQENLPKEPIHLNVVSPQTLQAIIQHPPTGLCSFFASLEHIPELATLSALAFGEESLTASNFRYYLSKAHALIPVLRRDDVMVTYTVIEFNLRQSRIYVVETFTAATERGQGRATWIRQVVEDIALTLGYKYISSHVAVTNTSALMLNQKMGLKEIKRIKGYYEDGREAIYLRKNLREN